MDYEPFGAFLEGSRMTEPYAYTGQRADSGTGLYYYGARFYDPVIGRFITADTWTNLPDDERGYLAGANPGGFNRYAYVLNNPVMYSDPTGHYIVSATLGVNEILEVIVGGIIVQTAANMVGRWQGEWIRGTQPWEWSDLTGTHPDTDMPNMPSPQKGPGRRKHIIPRIIVGGIALSGTSAEIIKVMSTDEREGTAIEAELRRGHDAQTYWERRLAAQQMKEYLDKTLENPPSFDTSRPTGLDGTSGSSGPLSLITQ